MRIRPRSAYVLAAAVAAGLLASGCDYWRNLVDERTVTRHRLDIKVFDVWTLEPLADAECRDKERGAYPRTPDNGLITVPEAETGHYEITCTHSQYLDFRSTFKLSSKGVQAEIAMARKGGKDWYPDDLDRQVQINYPPSTTPWTSIRFPSKFAIASQPNDPRGRFRYIWSFSQSPALNRDRDSRKVEDTFYAMDASVDEVKEGKDTLTLIVLSGINGGGKAEEYEVGRVTKVFDWIRNKPPVFIDTLTTKLTRENQFKVGCVGTRDHRPFRFNLAATDPDPDGKCTHMRIFTRDSNSSLGKINMVINDCDFHTLQFPLRNVFDFPDALTSQEMVNTIYATAYDDNFESTMVSSEFITHSNIIPQVSASIRGGPAVVYIGDEVKLDYRVSDAEGRILRIITNWGKADAENEHVVYNDPVKESNLVEGTDTHIYSSPSPPERPYDITISGQDLCEVFVTKTIGQLIVRENTPPKITLHTVRRDIRDGSLSLRIGFTLEDKEVFQDLDKYTLVVVAWGDDLQDTLSTGAQKTFDTTLTHLYTTPPRTLEGYTVEISAKDSHFRGTNYLDTLIAPP